MKIPKKIKIGGLNYSVEIVDIDKAKSQEALGLHHSGHLTILIDNRVPQDRQESTFIHEILEALNDMYELNLKHNILDILEAGLYQVLKDNDLLIKG